MPILIAALVVGFVSGVVFTLGWIAVRKQQGRLIFEWVGKDLTSTKSALRNADNDRIKPPHGPKSESQKEKPLH